MPDSSPHISHDDRGFSEEKCLRCGWVMGSPALNCQNDDTPHRFPSQDGLLEQLEAAERILVEERRWRGEALALVRFLRPDLDATRSRADDLVRRGEALNPASKPPDTRTPEQVKFDEAMEAADDAS